MCPTFVAIFKCNRCSINGKTLFINQCSYWWFCKSLKWVIRSNLLERKVWCERSRICKIDCQFPLILWTVKFHFETQLSMQYYNFETKWTISLFLLSQTHKVYDFLAFFHQLWVAIFILAFLLHLYIVTQFIFLASKSN